MCGVVLIIKVSTGFSSDGILFCNDFVLSIGKWGPPKCSQVKNANLGKSWILSSWILVYHIVRRSCIIFALMYKVLVGFRSLVVFDNECWAILLVSINRRHSKMDTQMFEIYSLTNVYYHDRHFWPKLVLYFASGFSRLQIIPRITIWKCLFSSISIGKCELQSFAPIVWLFLFGLFFLHSMFTWKVPVLRLRFCETSLWLWLTVHPCCCWLIRSSSGASGAGWNRWQREPSLYYICWKAERAKPILYYIYWKAA